MGHAVIEKGARGGAIDARAKDSTSYEVSGDGRFCGHRFILKQKLYGDKRCIYCGKWFHWDQSNQQKWINGNNLDTLNADSNIEPLHCGSGHCENYHYEYERSRVEFERDLDRRGMDLFKSLKRKGIL